MKAFAPITGRDGEPLAGPLTLSAPQRRPESVRRTSHVDTTRDAGLAYTEIIALSGRARDLVTRDREAVVVDEASLEVSVGPGGFIDRVEAVIGGPPLDDLVGKPVGFGFRSVAKNVLTRLTGTPLGLLVDDLSGAPAPAGYGAIREQALLALPVPVPKDWAGRADVCAGWRGEGEAYRLASSGLQLPFEAAPPVAPDLDGDDPLGWHSLPPLRLRQSRRLRRLDVWGEGDHLCVDAMFRDSTTDPDLTERVVHEYSLSAVIGGPSHQIQKIRADPGSLPFAHDCPLAAASAQRVLGIPVASLRSQVQRINIGRNSCTHLNDMLRSLTDIEVLARHLPGDPTREDSDYLWLQR